VRVRLSNARRFSSDEDDGDVARLSIQQLLSNSLVDTRRHLDLDRVQRYTQLLEELPPITVFRLEDQTLLLVDGYHRVAAAQEAGRATVDAEIREGTRAEAVRFAAEVAVREGGFSDEQAGEAIKRHSGGRWRAQDH
jgi:ParB-like chromosome segregation protein Spo0J